LQVGEVPAGGGVFGVAGDRAQLCKAVEAVLDGFLLTAGVFELGFDLGDGPFAALGTQEVADGGELVFEGAGEGLLLDGGNDGFFRVGDAGEHLLSELHFVGGLVFGAEPADVAVAFFFGALGVEGDKVFEDLLVGDVMGPAVDVESDRNERADALVNLESQKVALLGGLLDFP